MGIVTKALTVLLVLALVAPIAAQGAADADLWRTFATRLEVGSHIKVRLQNGERVSATLIQADATDLVIQPRTRLPVPVQHLRYDAIVSLERDDARGMGAGKAVAIGVAAGAGAFLGILLLVVAAFD